MQTNEQRYKRILRDYDYKLLRDGENFRLARARIPGYCAEELLPYRYSSAMSAAESLIPIIHDDEFRTRVQAVSMPERS